MTSLVDQFPALLVVLPLIVSAAVVMLRSGFVAWAASFAVAAATSLMALALAARAAAEGPISYAMGSWPPPWGIEYRVDSASALVASLVCLTALFVVPYCRRSAAAEVARDQHYLFYALFLLCLSGLLGMTMTGDAFNMFVFLEISSLSSYVLIALGRDRRALSAAIQYLLLGTVGATFYVIGVGLLYLMTGTLNFADMALRLEGVQQTRPVLVALAFITVGVGLKLALFPLHSWLPSAYAHAPSAIAAFLAATATKVSVYVLMRLYFSVTGSDLVFRALPLGEILIALSVAALFVASAIAIAQRDLKRLLAYSSVGQIGYITLGIGMASTAGLAAGVAHIVNHGITKGALFLLAGGMALRIGGTGFERLAGVGRTMPLTAFAFVIGGLSLIGVPGTAGFASKWLLVTAAIEGGRPELAAAVLLSSLLALAYVWRFVEAAYFREPAAGHPPPGEPPLWMSVPALGFTLLVVILGVHAAPVLDAAAAAARALEGVAP
jgi:multicomponent Na+:H+ antiporter subunit D